MRSGFFVCVFLAVVRSWGDDGGIWIWLRRGLISVMTVSAVVKWWWWLVGGDEVAVNVP
jgi:hypothetical protein